MNIITPQTVPSTTDRFVVLTEGDLQRLRAITAEVITAIHGFAGQVKAQAQLLKAAGFKEQASRAYDTQRRLLIKATALGKSQYALKHQALRNTEVVEYFNAADISLVQTSTLPSASVEYRSKAWLAVTAVLQEVAPDYMMKEGTGEECALQAIRDLAAGTYKQPKQDA